MVWNKLAGKYDTLWVQKYSLGPTRKVVMGILKRIYADLYDINTNADKNIEDKEFDFGITSDLNPVTRINSNNNSYNDAVKKCNPRKMSIIDIGCGTGQLLENISGEIIDCYLTGIDKSEEMIRCAEVKNVNAELICMDILSEDYLKINSLITKNKFDIAICCHSFPYYHNKPDVISKIHNMITENGHAIFVQASINNIYDKFVMSLIEKTAEKAEYLSREEFMKLVSGKFEIKSQFTIREKWFMPSICGFVLCKI